MSIIKQLNVRFDNPEHGWIGITVSNGADTLTIDADSKLASFSDLTSALLVLMDQTGEFTVWWMEEPVQTQWLFIKQEEKITFEFSRSSCGEPLLRVSGSYQEVCLPFWRALQSLKSRFTEAELEKRTQDGFPIAELNLLAEKISAMKDGGFEE